MNSILIIEDDEVLLDSIGEFLEEEGFKVTGAGDGEEGIEQALKHLPDLILCDISMPKKTGYEVFDTLKKEVSTSLIPFIFLTARAESEDILYAMKMGADDYITKPIDFDELLERIAKRMEKTGETIRRSEIKYHAVFETAHDAILLIRLSDFQIFDVNNAACSLLGYSRKELLETNGRDFIKEVIVKDDFDPPNSGVPDIKDFANVDTSWQAKDKRQIQVQASGKIVTLFAESYLFLMAHDITERKIYEDQLILAKEKAEESDQLKSTILSSISHELRTPLNGILGFSELLREELKEPRFVQMIENIHVSGQRLMATLNSIITLSQLQAGRITIVFKNVNLVEAINEVARSFQPQVNEKGITLRVDLPEEIIAYTDHQLFKQLFRQILDNAIKFTQEGEIIIRPEIVEKDNTYWLTLQVKDTGIGIDKDYFEMIFNEFRQVSEGYDRKYQGTGLGLTISRKICYLLKGNITVDSVENKGSMFTIWLPASKVEDTGKPEPEPVEKTDILKPERKQSERPLVLLVENNMVNKNLIDLFLKKDYMMDHAFEGNKAIKMAEKTKYDAILMDIHLGTGMDGILAAKKIRLIPGYEKIPIIAVTGYAMIGDREKLLAEGCTHYIAKPFEKASFLAVVNEAIHGNG